MDAITALTTRKSTSLLVKPAPSDAEIDIMLSAAMRAPDHGKLRPWRFIVVKGKGLDRLGLAFADAALERDADITPDELDKAKQRPHRAPLVIAVMAKIVRNEKIPEIEQILSAGAAAQNILLAAHALGYAGIWRSGVPCFDPNVRAALGGSGEDQIVGFLYLGTARTTVPLKPVAADNYVEFWT